MSCRANAMITCTALSRHPQHACPSPWHSFAPLHESNYAGRKGRGFMRAVQQPVSRTQERPSRAHHVVIPPPGMAVMPRTGGGGSARRPVSILMSASSCPTSGALLLAGLTTKCQAAGPPRFIKYVQTTGTRPLAALRHPPAHSGIEALIASRGPGSAVPALRAFPQYEI